jgi:hypothetical protein
MVAVSLLVILERKNLTPRPKSIHSQKSLVEAISEVPEEHQQVCEADETKEVLDVESLSSEHSTVALQSRRTATRLSIGGDGDRNGRHIGNA